ncbi:MAG: hypothetical protein PHD79_10235 [Aliarcobacter sp.]|nr:hypothetical protein [Aliarcobacter sp.]
MLSIENIKKLNEIKLFKDKVAFEFEDGWTDLIYNLGNNITELCKLANCEFPRIQQIKEKFGTLRFYYNDKDLDIPDVIKNSISALVSQSEIKSSRTCEYCGKLGELRVSTGLWFSSCEEHKKDSINMDEFKELQLIKRLKKQDIK